MLYSGNKEAALFTLICIIFADGCNPIREKIYVILKHINNEKVYYKIIRLKLSLLGMETKKRRCIL